LKEDEEEMEGLRYTRLSEAVEEIASMRKRSAYVSTNLVDQNKMS